MQSPQTIQVQELTVLRRWLWTSPLLPSSPWASDTQSTSHRSFLTSETSPISSNSYHITDIIDFKTFSMSSYMCRCIAFFIYPCIFNIFILFIIIMRFIIYVASARSKKIYSTLFAVFVVYSTRGHGSYGTRLKRRACVHQQLRCRTHICCSATGSSCNKERRARPTFQKWIRWVT